MTDPIPPAAAPAPVPAAPLTEAEDKQWAGFAHLGGIIGILPSLIIYLIFKDRGARTRVEAKEALNWQITVLAALVVVGIVWSIVGVIYAVLPYGADGIALILQFLVGLIYWAIVIVNVVLSIIAFTKVNAGASYRYPFAIRLIK